MAASVLTRWDVLRRTATSIAVSVCSTLVLTYAAFSMLFGVDRDALLRAGDVTISVVGFGVIASALLAGIMSHRANLMLQRLALAQAELWRISRTDQLTGLLNRRGFDEAAISALENAYGANLSAIALMCDIDCFKAINDRFGHEFGDAVLVEIGKVLSAFAEDHGILVGRHGGEEFAGLVIGATSEQALQNAEKLRRACAESPVSLQGTHTWVTVSIGLGASRKGDSLSKILGTADQALYAAKRDGRNRVARADVLDSAVAA